MDGPSRRPTEQCRSEGTPSLGEVPSGGAKALWLLSRFSKVTRRQGGTLSSRYRRNGYTHRPHSRPSFVGMVGQDSDSSRIFRRVLAVAGWEELWLTFSRRCQFSVRASRPVNLVHNSSRRRCFGICRCVMVGCAWDTFGYAEAPSSVREPAYSCHLQSRRGDR